MVINIVWIKKTIPDDWRRGIILPFWKNKGNKEVCSNHRGITLLSIPGKMFAMILLERIRPTFHNHRRSEQAGFTAGRSTTEQMFAIRQIIENRRNLICLPTLPLSTSKLPLTQGPVIPCGKFYKSVAFHRNFLFLCVNWREARMCHCTRPLQLCNRPPHASPAESL